MSVIDIKNLKPAKRYAKALIEFDGLGRIMSELDKIKEIFDKNPELKEFLEHPIICVADKKDAVKEIFENKTQKEVLDFLYVLLDENRINIFSTILQCLKEEYSAVKGVVQATVTSVIEFDEETKKRLLKVLEEKLSAKLDITYTLEPSLVGGFSVNIQDKVIDLSVRSKFEQYKRLFGKSK